MEIKVIQGHPAMVDATAFILPTNENLHLRGELGNMIHAVGGPLVQNDAIRQAPAKRGDIVSFTAGATSYTTMYGAVAYPFRGGDFEWEDVEATLRDAVKHVYDAGHRKIAVPLFIDIPTFELSTLGRNAGIAMFRAVMSLLVMSDLPRDDMELLFVAKSDREYQLLNELQALFLPDVAGEGEVTSPDDAPVDDVPPEPALQSVSDVQKAEKPKAKQHTKATAKKATTTRRSTTKK